VSALCAVLLLVASCGGDDDDAGRPLLDAEDSGSELQLNAGDEFEVRLVSNPTTGYSWAVTEPETLTWTLLDSSFEEPDSDLVGAAGTEIFVFEAVSEGNDVLRLEYVRPFDDPVVAEDVVEFEIVVNPAP
jgi:inhibitor of cysteine peptidase